MAVSIRNIKKFFDDHPEYEDRKEEVLSGLQERLGGQKAIVSVVAKEALGDLAVEFFHEATNNMDHIKIGLEDLQQN